MKFQVHCPGTKTIQLRNTDGGLLKYTHNDIVDQEPVFVKYPHVFMPRPDLEPIKAPLDQPVVSIEKILPIEEISETITSSEVQIEELEVIKIKKGSYKVVSNDIQLFPGENEIANKKKADKFVKEFYSES